jgi:predicted helicase
LQDDYVKFIRFAQMKMDGFTLKTKAPDGRVIEHSVPGVENGIVGVITNHSWLDNPTFRGMRQSLMRSFQQIYVLDLHGNAKKKERTPSGGEDQNVFDIEQGVAISVFVKSPNAERGVWRGDLWGHRLEKYQATAEGTLKSIEWQKLEPNAPNYIFVRQNAAIQSEYEGGYSIREILPQHSIGVVTARDDLTVHFDKSELMTTVRDFAAREVEDARATYKLGADVRDWRVAWAQADLNESALAESNAIKFAYRPFDTRCTYYTGRSRGFHCYPRDDVMRHMLGGNLGLSLCRFVTGQWRHILATNDATDNCLISSQTKERGYVFPLVIDGRENLSPDFRAFLDVRYEHHFSPEEILGYIYAVLHAPSYRARYAEFLRTDFPRTPFPETKAEFYALSKLGWALMQAHLLRKLPRKNLAQYHGKAEHEVEVVRYDPKNEAVWINNTQCFRSVPQAVWDFRIGGYQVLDKYLKSRKGRKLSLDEINHVSAVADALAFTIQQMAKIDEAYRAAFPKRG